MNPASVQISRGNPIVTVIRALAVSLILLAGCSKDPAQLMKDASRASEDGKPGAAAILLKDLLQRDPANAEARYLLAVQYNALDDGASAEKEARKAGESGLIKGGRVSAALGRALLLQKSYRKILDEVKPSVAFEPEPLAVILALRGRAHLALGQKSEAFAMHEEAAKTKGDVPEVGVLQAMLQVFSNGDLKAATATIEQVLASHPKHVEAQLTLGDLFRWQGMDKEALATMSKIIDAEPWRVHVRLARAQMLIRLRKPAEAQKDVDFARKLIRGYYLTAYTQALIYFSQGKYREAQVTVQDSLRTAPDFGPAKLLNGAASFALGSFATAETILTNVVHDYPDEPIARKILAAILLEKNESTRALEVIEPVLGKELQDTLVMSVAGSAYMKNGQYDKAVQMMERATSQDPENAKLRTGLAMARIGGGAIDAGLADLDAAAKLEGSANRAQVLLILTNLRARQFARALEAARELEARQPGNPLSHYLMGAVLVDMQEAPKARASFERALALQPDYLPAAASLARLDLADKNPAAAQKRYENILARNKNNVQVMLALADIARSTSDVKKMVEWLELARKASPSSLEPRAQLAAFYMRAGARDKALAVAQEAITANPGHPAAVQMMAMVQVISGDANSAVASYAKAAAADPKSPLALFNLGSAQVSAGRLKEAETSYRKAIALAPDFVGAQLALGALLLKSNRPAEALKLARDSALKAPNSVGPLLLEGDVLMEQGKYADALKVFDSALKRANASDVVVRRYMAMARSSGADAGLDWLAAWIKDHPQDDASRAYLADGSLAVGRLKVALEHYEYLTQRAPGNALLLNNMANTLYKLKDPRALATAEQAHKIVPDNPVVADTLGWILLDGGDTKRSLALIKQAAKVLHDVPEVRYHLAVALARTGDKESARKELKALVTGGKNFPQMDDAKALLGKL